MESGGRDDLSLARERERDREVLCWMRNMLGISNDDHVKEILGEIVLLMLLAESNEPFRIQT